MTVSTGAGLVFKVKENGGDITSILYKSSPELQYWGRGSHIQSGIGATVTYAVSGDVVKITLSTSTLTHYFLVRKGDNTIYMGTYITEEPSNGNLRWITRLNDSAFTNVPAASDNRNSTGAIESSDVYGYADGTTTSKYYGTQRAIDYSVRGITGRGVGVFMVHGNRESSSAGPFFRDIQNQTAEVYNIMNSGHNQTEANRMGFHGPYALIFTDGETPKVPSMTWMGDFGLLGWVGPEGRGKVAGVGISGRDDAYPYVVGFANSTAQYWTTALANKGGGFVSNNMKPGTYTMTFYKNELAVHQEQVNVVANTTTVIHTRAIDNDPSKSTAVWRIGDWDGTPLEFKNGKNFNSWHPSDVRNEPWTSGTFAVGDANNTFPAAQWVAVNNPITVTFNLTPEQVTAHTIRIGITAAFAGGRPYVSVNSWKPKGYPSASVQPDSRSLTIGTYRGNNTMYTVDVPASAFVSGTNTMTINVISGSSGSGFLSPSYAFDALDML